MGTKTRKRMSKKSNLSRGLKRSLQAKAWRDSDTFYIPGRAQQNHGYPVGTPGRLVTPYPTKLVFIYYLFHFDIVEMDFCLRNGGVDREEDSCWDHSISSEQFRSDPRFTIPNEANKALPRP